MQWWLAMVLARASVAAPGGPAALNLDEAVRLGIAHDARVAAAGQAVDRARAALGAAGVLTGPTVTLGPLYSDQRGFDLEAELSQVVLEPGRLPAERAARSELAAALVALEEARLGAGGTTALACLRVQAAERRRAVQAEDLALVSALRDAAERARDLGERPGIDVRRADLEVDRGSIELAALDAEVAAARAALAGLLGLAAEECVLAAPAALPSAAPAPETIAALLELHPRLRLARLEIERLGHLRQATRAAALPRLAASGFREDAEHGLRLSVELPLADLGRQRAAVREAEAAVREAELAAVAVERETAAAAEQARLALDAAVERRGRFGERVVPAAEQLVELARVGYRLGDTSLLEVLDARRVLADVRRESADLDAAVAEARIRLVLAVGRDLPAEPHSAPTASSPDGAPGLLGPPAPRLSVTAMPYPGGAR